MQVIINAGGTGTRLWPYSTNQRPKQFVPLIDDETFLRKTYDRLVSEFAADQIWVNTNINFRQQVIDTLPASFDPNKILTEPSKRDNFAAIVAHAAVVSHSVGEDEPLVFVHADHLIYKTDWDKFNNALKIAANGVGQGNYELVTAGVKPKFANTQLGYIEIDSDDRDNCFDSIINVSKFKEKPDQATAQEFVDSGNFLWNLGYFSFTFSSLLKNVKRFNPEVVDIILKIRTTGKIDPLEYNLLPKIAFDYAIAEKTSSLGVIGIDIDWEDIGSWEVASKYLPSISENDSFVEFSGSNNKVKSYIDGRKVAFVGVSDLILVESPDGILVIDPKYSPEVKKVAEFFEKK